MEMKPIAFLASLLSILKSVGTIKSNNYHLNNFLTKFGFNFVFLFITYLIKKSLTYTYSNINFFILELICYEKTKDLNTTS